MNFPYQKSQGGDYFPVINIFVSNKDHVFQINTLIDSGATVSIFKQDVAEQLGVTIEKGKEIYLGGVGGRIKGYLHKLEVEISGKKFRCPIVFSREYTVSFNLLGREAFFKQFRIIFEEKKNFLALEQYGFLVEFSMIGNSKSVGFITELLNQSQGKT